ncbi:hypothetical protein KSF_025160 [Reticulibacter mediterranei]|uniref:Uncharacterized protein n=1 Tax=Reticulibacter mediterranei TaxID=2778369 RepID=A0A8J3N1D1_9CHLR|nr:hypothetical protein KSF_025160 [Reticulibacter mediterranei]
MAERASANQIQGFPVLRSKGCRGLPAGAWGVPSFLPSFARRLRRRAKEKKKGFCGDTPHPGKGLPPSALPLDGRIGKPWNQISQAAKIYFYMLY